MRRLAAVVLTAFLLTMGVSGTDAGARELVLSMGHGPCKICRP